MRIALVGYGKMGKEIEKIAKERGHCISIIIDQDNSEDMNSTSFKQTDVAIELGGEDAKIIYFEGGNVEQRMNGICAGGTGSFIDQMASLIQTDASGLNEYAQN